MDALHDPLPNPLQRRRLAFQEALNLLTLVPAGLYVWASSSIEMLVGLLTLEVLYLVIVPDTAWFKKRLEANQDFRVWLQRETFKKQVWSRLSSESQQKFLRMEAVRHKLQQPEFARRPDLHRVLRRIDFLLDRFLLFAVRQEEFHKHLEDVYREMGDGGASSLQPLNDGVQQQALHHVEREIEKLQTQFHTEKDGSAKRVLHLRLEVLKRRRVFINKIKHTAEQLDNRLSLLEDTVGLIYDEICARPVDQAIADPVMSEVDNVISDSKSLDELLEEIGAGKLQLP